MILVRLKKEGRSRDWS